MKFLAGNIVFKIGQNVGELVSVLLRVSFCIETCDPYEIGPLAKTVVGLGSWCVRVHFNEPTGWFEPVCV